MQTREKRLAIIVGLLALILVANYGFGQISNMFMRRNNEIDSLETKRKEKQNEQMLAQRAGRKLATYEQRSLPANAQQAATHYRNWLVDAINDAELKNSSVNNRPAVERPKNFSTLSFNVTATGNLKQTIRFLHNFYSVNHLHLIRSLNIKPVDKSDQLTLNLTIEAMSLVTANSANELKVEKSDRLEHEDVAAYEKSIVGRNFFAAYKPPRPVEVAAPTPPKPKFDSGKYTRLTAILTNGDGFQAWLNDRTTGKLLQLSEGDEFDVGGMKGTVKRITTRQVEVESDGKRLMMVLGDSLQDASPMSDATTDLRDTQANAAEASL